MKEFFKKLKYYREVFILWRYHRNVSRLINSGPNSPRQIVERFFRLNKNNEDEVFGVKRNLAASIMKQLRNLEPYKPSDYSKAKKMYDEYFQMENHIPSYESLVELVKSGKDVYVVKFRTEQPIKGEKFCEYYINRGGSDREVTYKLRDVSESGKYINMEYADGKYADVWGISDGQITDHRFATEDEIMDFKNRGGKLKELNKQLDELQEKKTELYKEIEKVKKYR